MPKLKLLLAACTIASSAGGVFAQDAPITILTTYNANGFASRATTIMKPRLEEFFEQSIDIQFSSATQLAVDAPPDGNTLFISTIGNMALLPSVSASFDIDPLTDLQPVTLLLLAPDVLIAHSGLGINSLDELIQVSNDRQDALTYSHISPRSIHRVEFLALLSALGIRAELDTNIRGAAPAMNGVANGSVDLVITTSPYVAPLVSDGSAVPIAVAHPTRMPLYPDAPTLIERGVSAIPHGSWAGLFVPVGTPADKIERIIAAVRFAASDPTVISQIQALGMEVAVNESPDQFIRYIREENTRLRLAAETYGIEFP